MGLMLPFPDPDKDNYWHILIILDEKDIGRIQKQDPFFFAPSQFDHHMPPSWTEMRIESVAVVGSNDEDMAKIVQLVRAGDPLAARQHAMRGYQVLPGDTHPPVNLADKKESH